MWTILKYVVDDPNQKDQNSAQPEDEPVENVGFKDPLETIKEEIDKNAENYIISLHYLEFPIVIHYGIVKLKETTHLKNIHEYVESYKEARKILLMGKEDEVHGFYFLQNQVRVQKEILYSLDQETFDKRASESGLEPYIINDLRTIWKNRRLEQLQCALAHHTDKYYKPNENHSLYTTFVRYLEDIYKRGVDRFKTFICIGSTFIGKSVFFSKFIVPEEYYIYHSNYLEYSKMPNQPNKIFRILDDINWEQVTSTELKSLMNRNISSVNIKYGYEYIFPLIPVIIMNGEDYKAFRQHFADIWEFIERNAVIYPPQNKEVIEETKPLFTNEEVSFVDPRTYLFSKILDVSQLKECNMNNMNEWIKTELNRKESWKYDTKKYIQLPNDDEDLRIPNPELNKKTILKQYEEFLLKKKVKEMESSEEKEKKPREVWYKSYSLANTSSKKRARVVNTKFDIKDPVDKRVSNKKHFNDDFDDDDDVDDDDYDEMSDDEDEDEYSDSEPGNDFGKGFIQI